jgi:UDP-N-acetylmuramoyl-tripeptide--D-alanyl-D-alanine ligase
MKVMKTGGNFNSTTGAPLSIFSFSSNADIAIIEMGANKPNEIELICNVVKPNMGLITNIGSAHMEHFSSKNEIARTKSALFSSLPENGTAFVNIDDPFISKMNLMCTCISYSLNTSADHSGIWDEKTKKLTLNNSSIDLSKYPITMNINGLAVYSVASELGMDTYSIISKINTFKIPKGRGQIKNINNYLIIDDTYNSNLESMGSGIKTLIEYPTINRKIVVIGDMLELGKNKKKYHEDIAKLLDNENINAIFAFGKFSEDTIKNIFSNHIHKEFYSDKKLLINDLKQFINKNDVIYIKGSRSMKMEEIIMNLDK